VLECQVTRSQARNLEMAFDSLTKMCTEAATRPNPTPPEKVARVARLKRAEEASRRDLKSRQAGRKASRRQNDFRDTW
jgi:hypothetical protein